MNTCCIFVLANPMWFIHMVFLHVALENCYEHRHSHVYSTTFSVYGYLAWMLDTEIDSINQYWRSFLLCFLNIPSHVILTYYDSFFQWFLHVNISVIVDFQLLIVMPVQVQHGMRRTFLMFKVLLKIFYPTLSSTEQRSILWS